MTYKLQLTDVKFQIVNLLNTTRIVRNDGDGKFMDRAGIAKIVDVIKKNSSFIILRMKML